jgi:hypothetical protein
MAINPTVTISDFADVGRVGPELTEMFARIRAAPAEDLVAADIVRAAVPESFSPHPLGAYAAEIWRRWASGIFVCDWACFDRPSDRVDFLRLLYIVSFFPAGFSLWLANVRGEEWIPVGYTGWYPIAGPVFDMMYDNPESITHRGVIMPVESGTHPYVYLFNYSVIPQLRKTRHSARIVKSLARELESIRPRGMATIAVSEDGARVAARFGLSHRGTMRFQGEEEEVYVARSEFGSP